MSRTHRICTICLRFLALGATFSAAIIMVTSHEKINVFILSVKAKYIDTPSFKYFVIANTIASVYNFVALFLPPMASPRRLIVILDLIMIMLLTSSISSTLAIAYVGKKGDSHVGWRPICGLLNKFCDQVARAILAGFIGVLAHLVILLYSIYFILHSLVVKKHYQHNNSIDMSF